MVGLPPTASVPLTLVRQTLFYFLFFSSPHAISSSLLPPSILWGMSVLRIITHSSCAECICDVYSHPLAAASRHELPWKHLATQASDSLSWLGVVKPVKWNRWESVALSWSFCPCYLRHKDFIIFNEIFIFSNGLLMYFPITGVLLFQS